MPNRTACALVAALSLAACTTEGDFKLPGVYRIDIQQGNIVEQDMLSRLKPGMDENQVRFIMGTPVLVDPFHTDRWEYIFIFSEGGKRREQRHITVHFSNHKLAYVDGDIVVAQRAPAPEDLAKPQMAPIEVPLSEDRPGIFSRMFNALPFVGDRHPQPKKGKAEAQSPAPAAAESGAPAAAAATAATPAASTAPSAETTATAATPAPTAAPPSAGNASAASGSLAPESAAAAGSAAPAEQQAGLPEPGADESGAADAGVDESGAGADSGDTGIGADTGEPGAEEGSAEPAPSADQGDWPVERMPGGDSGWPAEPPPVPQDEPQLPGGDEGEPPQ